MVKYKAVIFDFDDTLVESREVKWAHHRHVAKKFYNIDLKDEALHAHWGKPLYTLISELYQNSDTLENMYDALISTRHDFLKEPYEGSAEMVKILIDHGLKIGVLSATNKKYLIEDLARLGFDIDGMTIIQGADETEVHKPNPNVFLPTLQKLKKEGIEKSDIVYVGDSLDDLEAANGIGIGFIGVITGLYSKEDFKMRGAQNIIENIKELPDLIENL